MSQGRIPWTEGPSDGGLCPRALALRLDALAKPLSVALTREPAVPAAAAIPGAPPRLPVPESAWSPRHSSG